MAQESTTFHLGFSLSEYKAQSLSWHYWKFVTKAIQRSEFSLPILSFDGRYPLFQNPTVKNLALIRRATVKAMISLSPLVVKYCLSSFLVKSMEFTYLGIQTLC
ncbi:hypothetical protein SLA2020_494640 [Shorea laevis]